MSVKSIIRGKPLTSYFIFAYGISWIGAFILVAPKLLTGQAITKNDGLLMFPVMLLGPSLSGIISTFVLKGRAGLKDLLKRMGNWKLPLGWYAFPLLLPFLILLTLLFLFSFVSKIFAPNFFAIGILFGIPAAFFEEIGWTGFALPRLLLKMNNLRAGIMLGLLWGFWHLPVIDFLGAASPHGAYLLPFFLSFVLLHTAVRTLMTFIYARTQSILMMQIIHAISTGSLVIFGPPSVSPGQETLWYFLYAVMVWMVVLIVFLADLPATGGLTQTDS